MTHNTTMTNDGCKTVDTALAMAVLPPLGKRLLQSRESDADADAEMSSSSLSEEDALVRGLGRLTCSFQSSTLSQT
ncbi:hypothetical protein AVEN_26185-1 [Araneus ventricosus]|uniref:Uncharacterized protein n=1 Tax=Araneus ventricosus TaxID=182803 RepID=A0A4Y2M4U4_ARAVE|nr:hypothetical protein AVEN_26185-1 [Araneus ventricosus]